MTVICSSRLHNQNPFMSFFLTFFLEARCLQRFQEVEKGFDRIPVTLFARRNVTNKQTLDDEDKQKLQRSTSVVHKIQSCGCCSNPFCHLRMQSPALLWNVSSVARLFIQYLGDHNVGSFINTRPTLFHKPLDINFFESSYGVRSTDRLSLKLQFLLKTASLCLSLYLIYICPARRPRDKSKRRKHFGSQ